MTKQKYFITFNNALVPFMRTKGTWKGKLLLFNSKSDARKRINKEFSWQQRALRNVKIKPLKL